MSFSIQIKESAAKELQRVARPDRARIVAAIDRLAETPHLGTALKGDLRGLRRIRVGDYRLVYEVQDDELVVLVVRVAHRRGAAISGDSMILRPGIQALLADARSGAFDVVVAEALDRMSRDQADVSALFKHLQFARVMIVTLAEGEINELHVGLKGTMNALFLKDLAAKTHRGLRGRVEKGRSGGGLCYGYDVVTTFDAAGEPVRGERTINEVEADVVRRVFRDFASGVSPRTVARRLNAEKIPCPSGKLWTDSTLAFTTSRRSVVLGRPRALGAGI